MKSACVDVLSIIIVNIFQLHQLYKIKRKKLNPNCQPNKGGTSSGAHIQERKKEKKDL